MSFSINPRAALCTAAILAVFGAAVGQQMPVGLFGRAPMEREGRSPLMQGGALWADRQRDIIGAVLLHEASKPGRRNVCLRLSEDGWPFAAKQRAILTLEQQVRADPPAPAQRSELDRLRNPGRDWLQPRLGAAPVAELGGPEARQLGAAETALLGAAPGRCDLGLDAASVPPEFRSADPGCNILYFTAPAVAGEIAFVETDYRCGPDCYDAWLYAVVWREDRWQVEAAARP